MGLKKNIQGFNFNRIRSHGLCVSAAVLYQLSFEDSCDHMLGTHRFAITTAMMTSQFHLYFRISNQLHLTPASLMSFYRISSFLSWHLSLILFQGPVSIGLCCLCPAISFFGERFQFYQHRRLEEFLRRKQKLPWKSGITYWELKLSFSSSSLVIRFYLISFFSCLFYYSFL